MPYTCKPAIVLLADPWPASCAAPRVRLPATNTTAEVVGGVDYCTVSGVTNGPSVEGIATSLVTPLGSCRVDADCGAADQFCSMASTSQLCTCSGGTDTCITLGVCRPTPCATCQTW